MTENAASPRDVTGETPDPWGSEGRAAGSIVPGTVLSGPYAQAGIFDADEPFVREYVGRSMYGKTCLGVIVPRDQVVARVARLFACLAAEAATLDGDEDCYEHAEAVERRVAELGSEDAK